MREYGYNTNEYASWLATLMSVSEWSALLWLIGGTLAVTHIIKVAWRLLPINGMGTGGQLFLIAAAVSVILAWFLWPPSSAVPWLVAGIVGGPASNVVFMVILAVLDKWLPKVANTVNGRNGRR